eukprot:1144582-Pelagomonas_calceolata.AAC.2
MQKQAERTCNNVDSTMKTPNGRHTSPQCKQNDFFTLATQNTTMQAATTLTAAMQTQEGAKPTKSQHQLQHEGAPCGLRRKLSMFKDGE